MRLTHLELSGFRIYRKLALELPPGLNVLWGGNAQGKTAFLEALYLLATSRSFRTRSEKELVHWEETQARVSAEFARDSGRTRKLEVTWRREGHGVERQVRLMGQPVRKLSEFLGEVLLTLFTPGDLSLVQAGPEERRRYLDLMLCKLYPTYLSALIQYQRVVKQRNELLRRQAYALDLEPWDILLARHGKLLIERREELAVMLDVWLGEIYAELADEPTGVSCEYRPQSRDILTDLHFRRAEEQRLKTTLVGPHRDELVIRLGERSLRKFGSQGQQRTAVLALRLAEARALQEKGEGAMVLLDDCLSELDPGRQQRLLERLAGAPQVFLTTAVPPPAGLPGELWRVDAGRVVNSRAC